MINSQLCRYGFFSVSYAIIHFSFNCNTTMGRLAHPPSVDTWEPVGPLKCVLRCVGVCVYAGMGSWLLRRISKQSEGHGTE